VAYTSTTRMVLELQKEFESINESRKNGFPVMKSRAAFKEKMEKLEKERGVKFSITYGKITLL